MKAFSESAKGHLDKYLQGVRACLKECKSVTTDEVLRDINEHIETELESATEPVGFDEVDGVLKRLGNPQQWVPQEELSWWRRIILRLRKGPEDWRLAYISLGLLVLAALFSVYNKETLSLILAITSFIISRAAVTVIGNDKELGGQKWLIYPSLVVVYVFIGFWLLVWPFILLFEIAQGYDHAKIDMFPWNTGNETPYWTLASMFFAGITFLWWLTLALVHKKAPQLLGTVFRPFAEIIKPKSINLFIGIMAGLVAICLITIVLMIKYQGWSAYFIKILG